MRALACSWMMTRCWHSTMCMTQRAGKSKIHCRMLQAKQCDFAWEPAEAQPGIAAWLDCPSVTRALPT